MQVERGDSLDAVPVADATLLAATEFDLMVDSRGRAASLAASLAVGQEILLAALRALGDRLGDRLGEEPAGTTAPGPPNEPSRTRRRLGHSPTAAAWTEIHLLLVGGAAGMLSGLLDPERTTTDCDVMLYHPVEAGEFVEQIASEMAGEFGLSERWLNRGGAPWAEAMPAGWEARRVLVLSRGPLRVHAVGRLDLIALKLVAGRAQDIEDLETMAITAQEFATLRRHFEGWTDDSWPAGVIAGALELLEILADVGDPAAQAPHLPTTERAEAADAGPLEVRVGADRGVVPRAERVRRFLDGEDQSVSERRAPAPNDGASTIMPPAQRRVPNHGASDGAPGAADFDGRTDGIPDGGLEDR